MVCNFHQSELPGIICEKVKTDPCLWVKSIFRQSVAQDTGSRFPSQDLSYFNNIILNRETKNFIKLKPSFYTFHTIGHIFSPTNQIITFSISYRNHFWICNNSSVFCLPWDNAYITWFQWLFSLHSWYRELYFLTLTRLWPFS